MKPIHLLTAAAVFSFTACDGEKAQEAKAKAAEAGKAIGDAAKATGEAAKEVGAKGLEKAKQAGSAAWDKTRELAGAVKEKSTPALETFKAKLGGLSEMFVTLKGQAGDDAGRAKQMMSDIQTKVVAISAEGLPQDIKTAFVAYQTSMSKISQIVRTMPVDEDGAKLWAETNADRLRQLEVESLTAQKTLKEVAAKYGLTGLHLGTDAE